MKTTMMKIVAVAATVVLGVNLAGATLVTFDVIYDGAGAFDVYATVTPGPTDNYGLSGFKISFGENVSGLANEAPTSAVWDGSDFGSVITVGFTQACCPTGSFPLDLAAFQDPLIDPALLVRGVGHLPGPASWPNVPPPEGLVYMGGKPADIPAPFLCGTGSYTGEAPVVVGSPTAYVWEDDYTYENRKVVDTEVNIIPEPATMALLSVGLAGVLLRRRRR